MAGNDSTERPKGFTTLLVGLGICLVAIAAYARVFVAFARSLGSFGANPAASFGIISEAIIPIFALAMGAIVTIVGLVQIFRSKRFHSENIHVGGDYISGSNVVAVHGIQGNVSLEIQQLARLNTNHARRVAESLDALTRAITNDGLIPADRKAQALAQVSTLARVAQGKKSPQAMAQADTALGTIKTVLAGIPAAAGTVAALNTLIGGLAHLFALV
jgi:hypothetical protein